MHAQRDQMPDFMQLLPHSGEMIRKCTDEKDFCKFRRLNTNREKGKTNPAFVGALARTDDKRCCKQGAGHQKQRKTELFQIPFVVQRRQDEHARDTEDDRDGLDNDIFDAVSFHCGMHSGGNDDNTEYRENDGNDSERTVNLTEMRTDGIPKRSCSFDRFAAHRRSDSFLNFCGWNNGQISRLPRFPLHRG